MTDAILIRDTGTRQGWAHVRLLGSALKGIGADVSRVTAGPDGLAGSLVAEKRGLDSRSLEQRIDDLRRAGGIAEYLADVVVEPIASDKLGHLPTEVLQDISVALFGSAGAPYHQLDVFAASGFDVAPIGSEAVRAGALDSADVFVMPGGGWEFMEGQLSRLGVDGAKAINRFVEAGGCYLSSCAGTHSVLQQPAAAAQHWHPAYGEMPKLSAESWLKGSRNTHYVKSPGIGVIRVRPHDRTHPVALGLPDEFDCVYYNGPIMLPLGKGYTSVLDCLDPDHEHFTPGEALFGSVPVRLEETAIAEAGKKQYSAGGIQPFGRGWVAGFGLHPEFGCEPSMLDWGVAARLLVNAAEWTTAQGRGAVPAWKAAPFDPRAWLEERREAPPPERTHEVTLALLSEIEAGFERLAKVPQAEVEPWLDRDIARSAFGCEPAVLWRSSLDRGAQLAREMEARLDTWKDSCRTVQELASAAHPHLSGRIAALRDNAIRVVSLPAVDAGRQDLGFKGLAALLADTRELLDTLTVEGEFLPFRAVAMSYLSAFGRLTAASLTLSASQAMLARARLMAEFASHGPATTSR